MIQDLRHAVRMTRLHPGFSALVVVTMALGIGLNSAVFSLLDALLLRPAPVAAPERLAHVYSSVPGGVLGHEPMAFPDYESVRDNARSFAGLVAYAWYPLALERGGGSELVLAELTTGNYFTTLGVAAAFGRTFSEIEDLPGTRSSVAVLSHDAWQRRFAGAPDVVGRELRLNGRPFTIVGIAPPGFRSLVPGVAPDLWLPIHAGVALPTGITINFGAPSQGLERTADRAQRWVWVTGRLRPGPSIEQAGAEVAALALQLAREFPATNARRRFTAVAAERVRLLPGVDRAVWAGSLLVMGVFVLGLVLGSINIAGLFLARALGRRREIATRLALGAARGQLIRQLFIEGLLLALAGAGLGLLVARASNAFLGRITLPLAGAVNWPLDLALAPALDVRVFCFTLLAAVVSALVFALVPALEATRPDLAGMLRAIGAGSSTPSSRRLQPGLVGAQVAVSVVLLVGAGAALQGLVRAARTDPGFDPDRAAVVTLSPELVGYGPDATSDLFARLRERVQELPGVRSTALASHLPLSFAINWTGVAGDGGDLEPPESWPLVDFASVGPAYFETMRVPLVTGRPFAETDGLAAPRVVIVNETLARRLWPDASAVVGRRLRFGEGSAEVIGVARDGKYRALWERPRPFLYACLGQDSRGTQTLVVRTEGDPRLLLAAIQRAVGGLDPRVPVGNLRTLAAALADALFLQRAAAGLFAFFSALGLLLVAVGIFGVVGYLASTRTHEIGVRLALGATRGAILRRLLWEGLAPVAAGLAVGVTLATGTTWSVSRVFAGLRPIEGEALLGAASLLALVGFAAALFPAWRACAPDVAAALRRE